MRHRTTVGRLVVTLVASGCSLLAAPQTKSDTGISQPIKRAGDFASPNGKCRATLTVSSMGGFLILTLSKEVKRPVNDVTGMLWTSDDTLIYTTSPVYGRPGVYAYDCGLNHTRRIVPPRTFSKAYPDGADYFQLSGVSSGSPPIAYFYYAHDVDAMDLKGIESPNFLFQVQMNGADFKKVQ